MLNLLRAQWYCLARNRMFWGFLALFAVVMAWDLMSIGQNYHGQEGFRNIPPIYREGVGVALDPEGYLGEGGVMYFFVPLVLLFVAVFFGEEFRAETCRSLVVGPSSRRDLALASAVTVALLTVLFVIVGLVAVYAVIPRFPLLDVGLPTGRTLRWALQLVLIVEVYGLLTVAVAAATKRVAPTVIAMLLLATGQAEVLLMNLYVIASQLGVAIGLPELFAAAEVSSAFFETAAMVPTWLPAAQLQWMMGEGCTPVAGDIAPVALLAAGAFSVALLVIRRRAL